MTKKKNVSYKKECDLGDMKKWLEEFTKKNVRDNQVVDYFEHTCAEVFATIMTYTLSKEDVFDIFIYGTEEELRKTKFGKLYLTEDYDLEHDVLKNAFRLTKETKLKWFFEYTRAEVGIS